MAKSSKAVVFGDDHAEFHPVKCRRVMQKHDECLGTISSNTNQDDVLASSNGKVMDKCCSETPKATTSVADHQDSQVNYDNKGAPEDESSGNDREFDGADGGEDAEVTVSTVRINDSALPTIHNDNDGHDGGDGGGDSDGRGRGGGSDEDPSNHESDSDHSYAPQTLPCQIKVDTMVTAVFDHGFECKSRWTDTWNGAVVVADPDAFPRTWMGFNTMAPWWLSHVG